MKNLIRKILKEDIEANLIILEEIFLSDDFFIGLINEGIATVDIPPGVESSIKAKLDSKKTWSADTKTFWCGEVEKFEDKSGEIRKKCNRRFDFEVSNHWLQRLYRTEEPDYSKFNHKTKKVGKFYNPKIVNPGKFEGIDLFFDASDKIMDFIRRQTDWSSGKTKKIILKKGDYEEIISLYKNNPKHISVNFITQIKGVRLNKDKNSDKAIPLY